MALGRQVVDFIRLHGLDDADQGAGIRHVAIVEVDQPVFLHVPHPLVQVKMLDAARVEGRGAAQDAVYFIALVNQELCEKRTVLSRDAGD